jgi:uncharacterized protein involved in response to NO
VATLPVVSDPQSRQAEFAVGFIWVALATAVLAGFAIGAHLAMVIGLDIPLGKGFASFVQTHGHLQLIGWAGLFIIGISLHVIPRLASVPVANPRWIPRILWLVATGLLLRAVGQTTIPYVTGTPVGYWLAATSGVLEGGGVGMYVLLLLRTLRGIGDSARQPALYAVRPYFGMMLVGWLLYTLLNLTLLFDMAWRKRLVVDQAWNQLAIELFIGLVLLPVTFGFSVRMLPLYLTLRAPDWPVRRVAYSYLGALMVQVLPAVPLVSGLAPEATRLLSDLGMLCKGGAILWFVWELDILTPPDKRPTRPGLPDYGEFGRFERLVYAAYGWLVIAAACEILVGGASVLGRPLPISTDVMRHLYLLGFVTHLIFGVSVRLIPGLLRQRCVASPGLVDATFWLVTTAAVCRVLPLMVPPTVIAHIPWSGPAVQTALALSGIIALVAVCCLAINLWRTAIT